MILQKETDRKELTYNPDQRPPDFNIAQMHALANRFGVSQDKEGNDDKRCPCCGLPIEVEIFGICEDREKFVIGGPGIQQFFDFLMFTFCLLVFQTIFSGIYDLMKNQDGQLCRILHETSKDSSLDCQQTYFNIYSLTNRNEEISYASSILHLFSNIFIMVFTLFYRKRINAITHRVDEMNISVEDYSVLVSEIPLDATLEEIKTFFSKDLIDRPYIPLKKHKKQKKHKDEKKKDKRKDKQKRDKENLQMNDINDPNETSDKNPTIISKENLVESSQIDKAQGEIMKFDIKKICLAYDLTPYQEIFVKKEQTQNTLTSLLNKNKDDPQCQYLRQQALQLEEQMEAMEMDLKKLKFAGACILSLQTEDMAQDLVRFYKIRPLQKLLFFFSRVLPGQNKRLFRETHLLNVQRAPTPGDVLWENMGITEFQRLQRQIMGSIASSLVLAVCFGIILGVSVWQVQLSKENDGTDSYAVAIQTILGLFISVIVSILNNVLAFSIRFFAQKERHLTQTDFNISIAKTLGLAQFMNTALITLLVRFINTDNALSTSIWRPGGLNASISLIMLTNTILPSIMQIVNPGYIIMLITRNKLLSQGEQCNYTQKQAHIYFQGITFDPAQRYAQITKTLLLTYFYAYLLPFGLVYGAGSLLIQYWTEKYLLTQRYYKPAPLNDDLVEEMVDFYIEVTMVAFASGCAIWEKTVYGEVYPVTILQIVLSTLYFILPLDIFLEELLEVKEGKTDRTYDEAKSEFWDDYDRRNPATSENAIEQWLQEQENQELIQKFMNKNKQLSKGVKAAQKGLQEAKDQVVNKFQAVANIAGDFLKIGEEDKLIESGDGAKTTKVTPLNVVDDDL